MRFQITDEIFGPNRSPIPDHKADAAIFKHGKICLFADIPPVLIRLNMFFRPISKIESTFCAHAIHGDLSISLCMQIVLKSEIGSVIVTHKKVTSRFHQRFQHSNSGIGNSAEPLTSFQQYGLIFCVHFSSLPLHSRLNMHMKRVLCYFADSISFPKRDKYGAEVRCFLSFRLK